MPISRTVRHLDEDLHINADGLQCDRDGIPILQAGGGGSGFGRVGHGTPEGSETAPVGTSYLDLDTNNFWFKATGSGNTGWAQLIG